MEVGIEKVWFRELGWGLTSESGADKEFERYASLLRIFPFLVVELERTKRLRRSALCERKT